MESNGKMLTVRVDAKEHTQFSRTLLNLSSDLNRRVSGQEILRKLVNRIATDSRFAKEVATDEK